MSPIVTIFPKFFRDLSPPHLAERVQGLGLEAVNAVVREGFWCEDASLAKDLPRFVQAMNTHGLQVPLATTGWSANEILQDPQRLQVLADAGVRRFRMGYFRIDSADVRGALDRARDAMRRLADVCAVAQVQAIYQVHHRMLIASPSAAYRLVEGLPPQAVGVMLDPGNQAYEGHEAYNYALPLLGPSLAAVGVKSCAVIDGQRQWVTLQEGDVDWPSCLEALHQHDFVGPYVLMPHFFPDDPARHLAGVQSDVAHFHDLLQSRSQTTHPSKTQEAPR